MKTAAQRRTARRACKAKIKRRLASIQRGLCLICGKTMPKDDRSLEHLSPKSLGGKDVMSNYALSHRICNIERGNGALTKTQIGRLILWYGNEPGLADELRTEDSRG